MSEALREAAVKGDVRLEIQRGDRTLTVTTPIPDNAEYGHPMLGVTPALQRYSPGQALQNAAGYTWSFEADITDDTLTFSYRMREGVARNMNASFLMKKMGITLSE